jgi:hypothetical protein
MRSPFIVSSLSLGLGEIFENAYIELQAYYKQMVSQLRR